MPITRTEIDTAAEGLEELLASPGFQMMWHERVHQAIRALHRSGRFVAAQPVPAPTPPPAAPNIVPATEEEAEIEPAKTKRTYKKRATPAKTVPKKGRSKWRY